MSASLLKGGASVVVYDIDDNATKRQVEQGASSADSILAVCQQCEILFVCLPSEREVGEVVEVLHNHPNRVELLLDASTLKYQISRNFERRCINNGIRYCDCPVSGLPARAANGTLTIMFGGNTEDFESTRYLLEMMGSQILHCGPVGTGQMMKAVNNIIYDINISAFCEILPLAAGAGLDIRQLETLLLAGSCRSFASEHFVPRILDRKFSDDFSMKAAYKDIDNIRAMASQLDYATPITEAMVSLYDQAIDNGCGNEPKSAMIKVNEKQLDLQISRPDSNDE